MNRQTLMEMYCQEKLSPLLPNMANNSEFGKTIKCEQPLLFNLI